MAFVFPKRMYSKKYNSRKSKLADSAFVASEDDGVHPVIVAIVAKEVEAVAQRRTRPGTVKVEET